MLNGSRDSSPSWRKSQASIPVGMEQRNGLILLFQLDHLSGEEIGWALGTEEIPGLKNRHLIPTLTKKGRPGYLLLLDIDPKIEVEAVGSVVDSLPVFGYHRLISRHVFRKAASLIVPIVIEAKGKTLETSLHLRSFSFSDGTKRFFLESDDLGGLHRQIKRKLKVAIPLLELKHRIEVLLIRGQRKRIKINL